MAKVNRETICLPARLRRFESRVHSDQGLRQIHSAATRASASSHIHKGSASRPIPAVEWVLEKMLLSAMLLATNSATPVKIIPAQV